MLLYDNEGMSTEQHIRTNTLKNHRTVKLKIVTVSYKWRQGWKIYRVHCFNYSHSSLSWYYCSCKDTLLSFSDYCHLGTHSFPAQLIQAEEDLFIITTIHSCQSMWMIWYSGMHYHPCWLISTEEDLATKNGNSFKPVNDRDGALRKPLPIRSDSRELRSLKYTSLVLPNALPSKMTDCNSGSSTYASSFSHTCQG